MSTEVLESLVHTHYPAAARGDRDAYGRIVAGCQNTVTSIALAIVRDVPTSEDIAQEASLSAWQNLRTLSNPASFLPWLRQITRNLARDHLRSQACRRTPAGVATLDVGALGMAFACGWWFPRILARRRAHELRVDPVGAGKRQRRERILSWVGAGAGLALATAGVALGLYFSGRLG